MGLNEHRSHTMKRLLGFARATLVGGLFFLLPLLAVLLLLKKTVHALGGMLRPIANQIPVEQVAGLRMREILAAVLLVLVAFAAGLFAATSFGRALSGRLEDLVLRKMPGYTLLKGAAGVGDKEAQVALVRFDDNTVLAFVMDGEAVEGKTAVFVPGAPSAASGAVYYVDTDRIERIGVPVADVAKVMMRMGVGSKELLARRQPGSALRP